MLLSEREGKVIGDSRKIQVLLSHKVVHTMSSSTANGSEEEASEIIHVTPKGQATIPKPLREKFGIDTPGKVLIREEDGKIVVEPAPSAKNMRGIHAEGRQKGEVLKRMRELREEETELERERERRLRPDPDE